MPSGSRSKRTRAGYRQTFDRSGERRKQMPNNLIVGIDPGISGGIGVINPMVKTVAIFPTPTTWAKRAGQRRQEYDLTMLVLRLLWLHENGGIHLVVIERGGARPGQHAGAVYRTGYGVGLWHGLLTGLRY